MARYARGVTPGIDITALQLHSVRETALGAFLDLDAGRTSRAVTALRNVLALQHETSAWPWSGTFPVTAEQPEPPGAHAVEWVHYDPNWRQFLGCILALTELHHGPVLPDDVRMGIVRALTRCVAGEPDERIAPWYTNPNLMHAWLLAHVGSLHHDDALTAAGEQRATRCARRFERFGDVDEYNSPTYDGIDLFALGLWAMHPPSDVFQRSAATMLDALGARIGALYHPALGAVCGPHIRAYGVQLRRYVSLTGMWLSLAGVDADDVLPADLDQDTDHVHDLYFLPLLRRLAPAVVGRIATIEVSEERTHRQAFDGVLAESLLRPGLAVGWEYGRRHEASLDQYVPFTAHTDLGAVAVMVPEDTAWIDARRVGDLTFEIRAHARRDRVGLRLIGSADEPTGDVARDLVTVGPAVVHYDEAPAGVSTTTTHRGIEVHPWWTTDEITVRITVPMAVEPGSRV